MAYLIETVTVNDYRCICCMHRRSHSQWVENLEKALEELPREFPVFSDWGGTVCVSISDGATSKVIAKSEVSWPPQWQRGDPYKYTMWTLHIDEEAAPGQGCHSSQIISGTNVIRDDETSSVSMDDEECVGTSDVKPPPPKPSLMDKLITDKTWGQICDELSEAKRLLNVAKAEADLAAAQKRLAALRPST